MKTSEGISKNNRRERSLRLRKQARDGVMAGLRENEKNPLGEMTPALARQDVFSKKWRGEERAQYGEIRNKTR